MELKYIFKGDDKKYYTIIQVVMMVEKKHGEVLLRK